MKTTRLEAFSDGVIAVIITIMVLELHVPEANGLLGLWHLAPRLGIYALSFTMTGIYWINHHELLRRTETANYHILWTNLLFLFTLSLIPFFTGYAAEKHFDAMSTALYTAIMILAGLGFLFLRLTVNALHRRTGIPLSRQERAETRKHMTSLCLYTIAIPVALYRPYLSFAIILLVTLIWFVPELGIRRPYEGSGSDRATH